MTDRELLELAAKAAGMDGWTWCEEQQCMKSPAKESPYGSLHSYWNPREDDGAAMRLAVKAKIDIEHNDPWDNSPWVLASRRGCEGCFSPLSCIEDDFDEQHREAATRRAIVRAAAEIGKGME